MYRERAMGVRIGFFRPRRSRGARAVPYYRRRPGPRFAPKWPGRSTRRRVRPVQCGNLIHNVRSHRNFRRLERPPPNSSDRFKPDDPPGRSRACRRSRGSAPSRGRRMAGIGPEGLGMIRPLRPARAPRPGRDRPLVVDPREREGRARPTDLGSSPPTPGRRADRWRSRSKEGRASFDIPTTGPGTRTLVIVSALARQAARSRSG